MGKITELPFKQNLETKKVLKKCAEAERRLAELKGMIESIPNEEILLALLPLQEAQMSSEIENIVTTTDELYQAQISKNNVNSNVKEARDYSKALLMGWEVIKEKTILSNNTICKMQAIIKANDAGFRIQKGTVLKNNLGETIYTPPQNAEEIRRLMKNLEEFINDDTLSELNPLIKMALIHYQFESIHPFYDGNGRVGRIINILYLSLKERLNIPILYLSRFIIRYKDLYYKLLLKTREENRWEEWILFMLDGIILTSLENSILIKEIKVLMLRYKQVIRKKYPNIYSQEMINILFKFPYTKISFIAQELKIYRATASKYLDILCKGKLLERVSIGRNNYYVNQNLINLSLETRKKFDNTGVF